MHVEGTGKYLPLNCLYLMNSKDKK